MNQNQIKSQKKSAKTPHSQQSQQHIRDTAGASNRQPDLGESARLMVWGSGSKQHFPSQSHSAGRKYITAFPPLQCFWVLSSRPDVHTKAKNYDCLFNPDPACGSMRAPPCPQSWSHTRNVLVCISGLIRNSSISPIPTSPLGLSGYLRGKSAYR